MLLSSGASCSVRGGMPLWTQHCAVQTETRHYTQHSKRSTVQRDTSTEVSLHSAWQSFFFAQGVELASCKILASTAVARKSL